MLTTILWLWTAAGLACTGGTEGRVVGFAPDGSKALVRLEHDRGEHMTLDIAVLDLATGKELKRWPILEQEDAEDPAVRGRNWKKVEAAGVDLGLVVDPELEPVWQDTAPLPDPIALPDGPTLRFAHASETPDPERPDDVFKQLVLRVNDGETQRHQEVLATWPWYSSTNSWHFVEAVWAVPGGTRSLVQTRQGCSEPGWHPIPLRGEEE